MAFERMAAKSDVAPGEVRVFELAGRSVALANVDGTLYALDNVCTHDGGTLGEGVLFGRNVECPRHGARFEVGSGRVTALPAVLPVRAYPVEVEGDDVKVNLDV